MAAESGELAHVLEKFPTGAGAFFDFLCFSKWSECTEWMLFQLFLVKLKVFRIVD